MHDILYPLEHVLARVRNDRSDTVTDRAWFYLRSTADTLKILFGKRPDLRGAPALRAQSALLQITINDLRVRLADRIALESAWSGVRSAQADLCLIGYAEDAVFAYSGQRLELEGKRQNVSVFQRHLTIQDALRENADAAVYSITSIPNAAWRTFEDAMDVLCERCETLRSMANESGQYPFLAPRPFLQ